jgi:hypothetical protein
MPACAFVMGLPIQLMENTSKFSSESAAPRQAQTRWRIGKNGPQRKKVATLPKPPFFRC